MIRRAGWDRVGIEYYVSVSVNLSANTHLERHLRRFATRGAALRRSQSWKRRFVTSEERPRHPSETVTPGSAVKDEVRSGSRVQSARHPVRPRVTRASRLSDAKCEASA